MSSEAWRDVYCSMVILDPVFVFYHRIVFCATQSDFINRGIGFYTAAMVFIAEIPKLY